MKTILLTIFAILFASCGEEQFTTIKATDPISIAWSEKKIINVGFNLDAIKPKVDFLFIWDNSGSQTYVSTETKQALAKTLTNISSDFDYRILLSPLLAPGVTPSYPRSYDELEQIIAPQPLSSFSYIFSPELSDLPSKYIYNWRHVDMTSSLIESMPTIKSGMVEPGINRAIGLLKTAQADGLFRQHAYTIIVLISNGDDTSNCWTTYSGDFKCSNDLYNNKLNELSYITRNLESKQVRFFSLVPFTNACKTGARAGYNYSYFSQLVYNSIPASGGATKPYLPQQMVDSYDFCSTYHFETLFQGINNTIKQQMPYTYQYWPVYLTDNNSEAIPYNLEKDQYGRYNDFNVFKVDGTNPNNKTLLPESTVNGWTWSGLNIGQTPTPPTEELQDIWECTPDHESSLGECSKLDKPLKGYFIKLNGDLAKAKWPDYIRIETTTSPDYYGYIRLRLKPIVHPNNKPVFFLNGINIPESAIEYLGDTRMSKNLKIKSRTDFNEDTLRPDVQTGYIFKIKSSQWVYTNGDNVTVKYDPSGS